jgi:hypothetical protein
LERVRYKIKNILYLALNNCFQYKTMFIKERTVKTGTIKTIPTKGNGLWCMGRRSSVLKSIQNFHVKSWSLILREKLSSRNHFWINYANLYF